jgi:hypothetical protein
MSISTARMRGCCDSNGAIRPLQLLVAFTTLRACGGSARDQRAHSARSVSSASSGDRREIASSSIGHASASVRSGSGSRRPCTSGQVSINRLSSVEPQWPMWKIACAGAASSETRDSSDSSGAQPPSAFGGTARSSRNAASRRCASSSRNHSTRRPTRSSLKGRKSGLSIAAVVIGRV